jgi:carboxylesterase type B
MMGGSSSSFDFTRFVQAQHVIVVSVNYRLGPLGFLVSDQLQAEPSSLGNGGMNGELGQGSPDC